MASRAIKTEPEEVESVHKICRLCLSQESLYDVFTEEGVCQWISDYLSIMIMAGDNMSHSICSICRIRLAEFHQFRVRSQEVQDMLQSTLCSTISIKEMKMVRGSVELEQQCHQISLNSEEHLEDEMDKELEVETRESDQKRHTADKLKDIKLEPYENIDSTIVTHEHAVEQMPRNVSEQYNSEDSDEEISTEQSESDTSIYHERAESDPPTIVEDMIDIDEVKIERLHSETSEEDCSSDTDTASESMTTQQADLSNSSQTTDRAVPIAIEKPGSEQVQCSICLKEFPNKGGFKNHKFLHTRNIFCSICEKPFLSRVRMQLHMRMHLPIKERKRAEKPFKCEICEKSFGRKCNLKAHKKQVHGPKTHPCPICGLKLARRTTLMSHLQKHNLRGDSEQDYQSLQLEPKDEIDGKDTNSDPSNDSTFREKKFKCGECREAFQTEMGLYRHYKFVHGKKFKCSLCNKVSGGKKFLEAHILKVHTPKEARLLKEKQFKCDECSRVFMRRRHLMAHLQQVHGPKSFECHLCDSKYGIRGALNRHLRTKHGDSKEDYQTLQ